MFFIFFNGVYFSGLPAIITYFLQFGIQQQSLEQNFVLRTKPNLLQRPVRYALGDIVDVWTSRAGKAITGALSLKIIR